jgi:hypothetical protein
MKPSDVTIQETGTKSQGPGDQTSEGDCLGTAVPGVISGAGLISWYLVPGTYLFAGGAGRVLSSCVRVRALTEAA